LKTFATASSSFAHTGSLTGALNALQPTSTILGSLT
jgi:hypothetical protein